MSRITNSSKDDMKEKAMSNLELKKHKREMEEQVEEERTRRRWERNYSSDDSLVGTHDDSITVYYCSYCSAPNLIYDGKLDGLPTRKSDGARCLKHKRNVMTKWMTEKGLFKEIRRQNGLEKQWRQNCKQCGLDVAYRCTGPKEPIKATYIIRGALSDNPKQVEKLMKTLQAEASTKE